MEKHPRLRPHETQLRPPVLSAHQQARLGQLSLLNSPVARERASRGDEVEGMDLAEVMEVLDNAS